MTVFHIRGVSTWRRSTMLRGSPTRQVGQAQDTARHRRRRRRDGWLLLAVGVAVLVTGTIRGHGLIMAAGFVLTVAAMYLLDTGRNS